MDSMESASSELLVPVVGIGASAGGLDAIVQLLEAVPADLGLSYLVVSHLDPRQESHLAPILARRTAMPVEVASSQTVEPNTVYVLPPDAVMTLDANTLVLSPREENSAKHLPVDLLFESLAHERPARAIGVVLSGTGSDGAQGVKDIREAAGITLVQQPASAAFDGMPHAAIQTGCVDRVLRPHEIAAELAKVARHTYFRAEVHTEAEELPAESALAKIFALLDAVYQADFTHYKPNTIQRRLQRRMALVNETEVHAYLELLLANPVELAALYDDLLIRVTSFFREEAIFATLRQTVFLKLPRATGGQEAII